ncbi:MAG: Adenylate cyclase [Myxococcaceae bacterium]|nr:Adenylate cyclase [Myxococcaceae bacterium]
MPAAMLTTRAIALVVLSLGLGGASPLDQCKQLASKDTSGPDASEGSITVPAVPVKPALSFEDQSLKEAKQLCATGDCQTAHDRLAIALPANSPVRATQDFKDIENKWANSTIAGAQNDPDVIGRRRTLEQVIASTSVDAPTRERAKTALAAMPTKAPPPLASATAQSDLDLAKLVAPTDSKKARDILLPKIQAKKASKDETDYLTVLCSKMKDKACLAAIKASR